MEQQPQKRPTDTQPQNEILRSWGLEGYLQQAAPEAEWLFGALLAYFSEITKATIEIVIDSM